MKLQAQALLSMYLVAALAACGPAPVPTPDVVDVQNTALALAGTAISMTKTAFPTATALPPTLTPTPTVTPEPTLSTPGTATPDPCSGPPPSAPLGTLVQVKFVNKSGGTVNLAFGMMQPDSLGECGVYSFGFGAFDSPVVKILAGCYWGYAWITGKKPSTAQSIRALCFTDPSVIRAVAVGSEVIDFNP